MMTNFYEQLAKIDASEKIEAIVFNDALMEYHRAIDMVDLIPEGVPELPADKIGVRLTLDEARPLLDYEADDLREWCVHRFAAWTATRVISVFGEFPRLIALPRNPGPLPIGDEVLT